MEVICLEEEAFYTLIERVLDRVSPQGNVPDQWIDGREAMRMLGIKATSTLQSLRDEGKIRFSQPSKKIILYDRHSINEYFEKHAKNPYQ